MPPAANPRWFTLAEARALLPLVADRMAALQRRYARYRHVNAALREGPRDPARAEELLRLRREIEAGLAELEALGVEVKGLDQGLVDFPALRDGAPVHLCWKVGEPTLAWWHPTETGFAGRAPIDPDDPAWVVWS